MFAMVVGERLSARQEHALAIGWNAEAFARTKRILPLADYLKPEPTAAEKRDQGAARLRAMLDRMSRKEGG